jgi:hypothetical protein
VRALVLALVLVATGAAAHDMKAMGKFGGYQDQYLYGMNRNDPDLSVMNCCKYNGNGDCQLFPETGVKIVPGGYLLTDGEFIPEREATVSPDENYYRCKYEGKPSHCFFAPAAGV